MDPQGNDHRSTECELDHECDQEIQEAIQKVYQRLFLPESNRYELDHESSQVVQQTNQEQDNTSESVHASQEVIQQTNQEQDKRSESVHGVDEVESQESSRNEGSHGPIVMKIQAISITRHYRGYTFPFNFRALDLEFRHLKWIRNFLHRRIVTATVAAIDDAANIVDLPIEELFLSRTSTRLPKNAGIPDTWSMDTREVAGDPCFFILHGSRPQDGTATFDSMVGPEYDERLARSSQSTESCQEKFLPITEAPNTD
ncbi:hypothetical protein BHYA_0017g00360 [Botrytis hyacinthi]|uniref:Uncharacterized protein n=1 Tax=Botrytis hyacinthi TaxID=278943 RepID=A0A4Z1GXT2_9HELO|nr:hypothetical protein BHYA_0017g00360 [Botrytis hyacinthi]